MLVRETARSCWSYREDFGTRIFVRVCTFGSSSGRIPNSFITQLITSPLINPFLDPGIIHAL